MVRRCFAVSGTPFPVTASIRAGFLIASDDNVKIADQGKGMAIGKLHRQFIGRAESLRDKYWLRLRLAGNRRYVACQNALHRGLVAAGNVKLADARDSMSVGELHGQII